MIRNRWYITVRAHTLEGQACGPDERAGYNCPIDEYMENTNPSNTNPKHLDQAASDFLRIRSMINQMREFQQSVSLRAAVHFV